MVRNNTMTSPYKLHHVLVLGKPLLAYYPSSSYGYSGVHFSIFFCSYLKTSSSSFRPSKHPKIPPITSKITGIATT